MTLSPSTSPADSPATNAALDVRDLHVDYIVRGMARPVLRGVSFTVQPGEAYGLVGESGCGKSTTAYAALRYLPRNGRISSGTIMVDGENVTKMSHERLRLFRAHAASMVYQEPGSALNPTLRIGRQEMSYGSSRLVSVREGPNVRRSFDGAPTQS